MFEVLGNYFIYPPKTLHLTTGFGSRRAAMNIKIYFKNYEMQILFYVNDNW